MKLKKTTFRVIQFIFLFNITLFAQWESDVRQTNDPAVSFTTTNNAWCIASSLNALNIIWRDNRTGNYEIYCKQSANGGINWGPDNRITFNSSPKYSSCISASGVALHIVWRDDRDGNGEIYYKRSTDEGITWESDTRLSNNDSLSGEPCIKVSGSSVHVMWYDKRHGNYEIYYRHSSDGGITWGLETRMSNTSANSYSPSIAIIDQVVHVVWFEEAYAILYKRSTDDGSTWSTDAMLNTTICSPYHSCISASSQYVQVTWEEHHDGNAEIYWIGSSDAGISWSQEVRLTNNTAGSYRPSIAASGQNIHIVWWDNRDGNFEIYYKQSVDAGNNWGPDTRLTNNPFTSSDCEIIASNSTINVVWYDYRDGNSEIYYKRNPTGNLTGIQTINSEMPDDFVLDQNYPNPFNPSTKIRFSVPKSSVISIELSDITGRIISLIVQPKQFSASVYEVDFDANLLATGIYFYSLYADGIKIDTKKMVLVK